MIVAVVFNLGAVLVPWPASAGATPPIAWAPCDGDPTAQCGTLSVPVDWARPRGARLDLALVRLPATEPAARIGSLVDVPGGPGDSGVDRVLSNRGRFITSLNRRFDIVGYDARGIGRSHPVLCSAELLAQEPPPVLTSQADFDARLAYNRRLRADCRARTGPVFDHVDTRSGVHDLDAIREALGEDALTFRGRSYGTLLGEQYAESYPRRVRALVLDSVTDHSLGTRAHLEAQAANLQDSFEEFVSWCRRAPECALARRDVRAVWARLLARAQRGELRHPDDPTALLSQFFLIDLAEQGFRGPQWALLAQVLADLDNSPAPAPARSVPWAEPVPYPPVAIFCSDYDLPVRDYREYAALLHRSRAVAPDMRYGTFAVYGTAACLGSPKPVANPQHRLRVHGAATPLLLVNGLHDPATGYNAAANVARQLGDEAILLTYRGWGHIVYGRSDCVDAIVDRYLFFRTPPPPGTDCPAAEGH
ncbi:alpha/beta fold hydrolase [Actinomadura rudentiformis]|uniref:alpha/beta fold hydrolase n=1 Tax=Actinomadura rudentiformis TaxID=359158 RepID=UPI001CEF7D3C|nr:alpha/beta fold hydrolase [Actinomadura rudentiformis]